MKLLHALGVGAAMLLTAGAHAADNPRMNGQMRTDIQTVMMAHIDQNFMGCARCEI